MQLRLVVCLIYDSLYGLPPQAPDVIAALLEEYLQAERDFRQVLAEMELLGYGKTQSFNSNGGARSDNPDPTPTGEGNPLHLTWRRRWLQTRPKDRPELVRDARTDLEAWRIKCVYTPDTFDETAWIIEDGEGYDAETVARRFNTTPTRIRRLRLKHDRDSERGLPKQFAPTVDDSADRVLYLHSRGCTLRQIQMQTGVSKSRVQRLVKEAA